MNANLRAHWPVETPVGKRRGPKGSLKREPILTASVELCQQAAPSRKGLLCTSYGCSSLGLRVLGEKLRAETHITKAALDHDGQQAWVHHESSAGVMVMLTLLRLCDQRPLWRRQVEDIVRSQEG